MHPASGPERDHPTALNLGHPTDLPSADDSVKYRLTGVLDTITAHERLSRHVSQGSGRI
jgi:hypothetical protein